MIRRTFLTASATVAVAVAMCNGCVHPPVIRTGDGPPTTAQLAEFWVDRTSSTRNLSTGVGGTLPPPVKDARYEVLDNDPSGFSITYRVKDDRGREWNVKIGPEAQTEVVSSRIVWALGYHQVPSYFVERWIAAGKNGDQTLGGGRFRPHDMGLKSKGTWSWQQNPFVGTQPYKGLLALMMIINSTDLKNDNNELYETTGASREGARRWFVVKDLGASLGETGRFDPRRGYIDGFEREPFVIGVQNGFVRFAFRGRHQELLQRITVDDVKWISARLLRITDRQWHDAFAAGGYADVTTTRYVARLKQKAMEGLALP